MHSRVPPLLGSGLHVRVEIEPWGGVGAVDRAIRAVWEFPFSVTVIAAVAAAVIVPADAVNVAEVAPAGTVAVAGTLNIDVSLESVTTAPELTAGAVRVIVQAALVREVSVPGEQETELRTGAAVMEMIEGWKEIEVSAVTVAVWPAPSAATVAVKDAETAPPGMITCGGTLTAALSLDTNAVTP